MDCVVEIIGLCSRNPTAVSRISARACGPSNGTACQLVTDTCRPWEDSTHLFFFFFAPTFPLESPYRSFGVSPGGASGPIPLSLLLLLACLCFLGSIQVRAAPAPRRPFLILNLVLHSWGPGRGGRVRKCPLFGPYLPAMPFVSYLWLALNN